MAATSEIEKVESAGTPTTAWSFTIHDPPDRARCTFVFASKDDAEQGKAAIDLVLSKVVRTTWP